MERLTPEGCAQRRQRLLETAGAETLVINNPRHIFYLTGLFLTPLMLSAWGLNSLLIDARGRATLLVHEDIVGQAREAHVDEVRGHPAYRGGDAGPPVGDTFGEAVTALTQALREMPTGTLGIERGWFPGEAAAGDTINLNPRLAAQRRRKDADELVLIREAVRATEAGLAAARQFIAPGVTELEVYGHVRAAAERAFGGPVHLMGDYVSGDLAHADGGGSPRPTPLSGGDVMIVDAFPLCNGYRADMTATIPVSHEVSPRQRQLDDALHEAQAAGEAALRPGARAAEVYRAVRGVLEARGFAEFFRHHAGHGLGLDHPEAPHLVPLSEQVLLAGDVVTLEPGAYGPDFAGRIEHLYLVTDDGCQRLSHHATRLFADA